MNNDVKIEVELTNYVHNLFLESHYADWRDKLFEQLDERWYSLVVELSKNKVPTNNIKQLGEEIYSKFVYRCIPSPNYRRTGEILVLFNVVGLIWHGLINLATEELK